jgi:hypothetical protein
MTITIAPKVALSATQPAVGIFWLVSGILVIDRSTLDKAETYGECLTHAGCHYERWQEWQALGGTSLVSNGYPVAIASTEYDEWPRGRIVYETPLHRFMPSEVRTKSSSANRPRRRSSAWLIAAETGRCDQRHG